MQHDPVHQGHDLDLRSNFQNDVSRSTYSSFDAFRREEYDAGKINVVTVLSQKLLQKTILIKTVIFGVVSLWRRGSQSLEAVMHVHK